MRVILVIAVLLILGGLAAACAFWAGADTAAPVAFALGLMSLTIVVPVWIGQLSNWGVPGDEPRLDLRHLQRSGGRD